MSRYLLPTNDDRLKEALTMILGAEPAIAAGSVDTDAASHVAIYVDADGNEVAVCYCDMAAATSMSCALSLIPPGIAEKMLADGELTEVAEENLHEVMNIFSGLFMDNDTDHLKLGRVDRLSAALEPHVAAMTATSLSIDTGKYPLGNVAFAVH